MANKRGRKRTSNLYFGPEQEKAVLNYLDSEDDLERNAIYNEWLREPLNKMIESIIRKYKLYRKSETFEQLHSDTLSFLMTKAHKFENSKGTKAYSYYGTICKNYILGLLISDDKKTKQVYSYEDIAPALEEKKDFQYELDDLEFTMDKFIGRLVESIKVELEGGKSIVGKKKISENEEKVGLALIDILRDWEVTLDSMAGGTKFNKNSVLESMRNYTGLNTKDIRVAMKRYKELYGIIKIDGIENGITD
jgi:hypothetical protein|tara:strand:- start:502 stop:1251 length:750 start_codon:yes stop_codon:yes gene_type:complete